MMKRIIATVLLITLIFTIIPMEPLWADWSEPETVEIKNDYIKVTVSKENGGYVVATIKGDILKKSDDDKALTHRGANMDTSFTSFRIGNEDYIFGNNYGFLGYSSTDVTTVVDPMGAWITSTWGVKDYTVEQKITLINSEVSEQLGTAMISYTVKNNSGKAVNVRSRVLMDTQLGDKDYGYYELPKQNLGQGYEYFEFERTWDKTQDPAIRMPADYFVRDNPFASSIVGFGVNSVFEDQKPYKMTFAHWANIAATRFDYDPDPSLNFTNSINGTKTADSAAALYFDLGSMGAGKEKTFSTYYGVTANLKNKDNKILINTTAPSKLEFKDGTNKAYKGSEKAVGDNIVRINTTVTNPSTSKKTYKALAVVVYAMGFDTQRQTDMGTWVPYDNIDPVYTDVVNFESGQNRTTYFDFKFAPDNNAQLGSFITKVYDMDEKVNELGSYAEEYCLGTTENFIILPGSDPKLPAITLADLGPKIVYNDENRYITVTGQGMSFFKSDLLNKIELRGENGKIYEIPVSNLTFEQGEKPKTATMLLTGYMEPGPYQLHFVWKMNTGDPALQGVPEDFTSQAMVVHMSSDPQYRNDQYGVVTVQRGENKKYKVVAYKNETKFTQAAIKSDDLLLSFRGDILQNQDNEKLYRMLGKNKNINISHMLNYYGSNLTIEEKGDGTVEVLMDGKITTVGANTTVRDGTAAFRLKAGTEYIVPVYDERGEMKTGGCLTTNQDYIELKWNNAFDTLRTIGGFLIDLKYGILGKIQNSEGTESYDIISFGGGLDLGFMTPGGAAKARENKKDGDKWEEIGVYYVDVDKGTVEKEEDIEIPPKNSRPSRVEAGATIHDVLYGGKKPGYLGINMNAHVSLPQIVSFLPNKIEADLDINTIGGYEVGIEGKVKTATLEMQLALVIKSNPSGAPIPDKLYFTIGGFEPGLNVDSVGVLWITGGGGGFDKLYDSIYGKDGLPPITVLLHIEFDVTKILTGSADLELSLRSISISFDDLSLKKLKDAKFVDGGIVAIGWYPNFSFNFKAGVNYLQILKGSLQITAGAGGDTKAFFEMVLRVALRVPKIIPVVGGMEIASAELGGGTEKVWGNITLLEIIKLGFVYYWGGDVEFTAGNVGGNESFGLAPGVEAIAFADAGERRSFAMFGAMTVPRQIGTDPVTGESQFIAIGSNLKFAAGSKVVPDFDAMVNQAMAPAGRMKMFGITPTEVYTNNERTSHLVKFGETANYILTISAVDGSEFTKEYLENHMTVKQNGSLYPLTYYVAPREGASDEEMENALKNANVNITGNAANIIIPKTHLGTNKNFLIEFNDGKAYDVGAIYVDPVSELKTYEASLSGNSLNVNWTGENISDTANIIVSVSDMEGQDGVILNTDDISAKAGTANLTIPTGMASGTYYVTLTLSDEEKCFEKYRVEEPITVTNSLAPAVPTSVTLSNAGDDKFRVNITPADPEDVKLKGYFIDVYEEDTMVDAGLYFDKDDDMLIGGRYEMPVMDQDGKPTGKSVTVGYTPEKSYRVKVRAGNIVGPDLDVDGDEVYYCSSYINSSPAVLLESTPPKININYDKVAKNIIVTSDVPVTGELYVNSSIADGKWYKFDTSSMTMTQSIDLPDGNHTLEFHAVDGDGDHAIVQQIISIDTTPPTFMIETPISGNTFRDSIIVKGTGDSDATYTFKLNGVKVNPIESDIFKTGLIECTLLIGNIKSNAKIDLEIIAEDAAENASRQIIELTNKDLAEVNSINVYSSNTPVTEGKINLEKSKTAQLRLMGAAVGGTSIDITDSTATRMEIFGGNSVTLKGNEITAVAEGQTMLSIQYDIGGGRVVQEGVVIDVAPDKDDDNGDKDDNGGGKDKDDRDRDRPKETPIIDKGKKEDQKPLPSESKWENPFKDIKATDWFYSYVEYVCAMGLFNGTTDGTFSPNMPMTRGMLATVLWRMDGTPIPQGKNIFNDISADWYKDAVLWANENNIVSGYGGGLFGPDDNITREQMAVMLYRYSQYKGYGVTARNNLASYSDAVDISGWAHDAMSWANAEGLITGRGNAELAPKDKASRAEIATILYRFMEKIRK